MRVYLAGPIADCNNVQANDWRKHSVDYLAKFGIVGVSPLRCESPESNGLYEGAIAFKEDKKRPYYKTARAISMKNKFDLDNSDVVLAYLPATLCIKRPTIGTIFEIAWGVWKSTKPVFIVSDWEALVYHPLVTENVAGIFTHLDEALDAITELVYVYTE